MKEGEKSMTDYKELAIDCGQIALICEQNGAQKLADHERKCRDAIFELLSALEKKENNHE